MKTHVLLPSRDTMLEAVRERDETFEGVFITGVKSTGIFCRPGCPAKTPKEENLTFFATPSEALIAGFRPCKKCLPMNPAGTAPPEFASLMQAVLEDPPRRWTDQDLRERGLQPERVRRWFQNNHGMTFLAYSRAVRIGYALGKLKEGKPSTQTAYDLGFESISGFADAFKNITGVSPGNHQSTRIIKICRLTSPLGLLLAGADENGICLLEFCDRRMLATQLKTVQRRFECAVVPGSNDLIDQLEGELDEYFLGERNQFDVPLNYPGTEFQQAVWDDLLKIPYGETRSYQDLANNLGNPGAVRAVARANGANRIAIIIPCHRVIGSDGTLTGYGGGLWRKQRLLELENAIPPAMPDLFGASSEA